METEYIVAWHDRGGQPTTVRLTESDPVAAAARAVDQKFNQGPATDVTGVEVDVYALTKSRHNVILDTEE